ncbi:VOC family protein [Nocardioides speluncae]|uniref:VOC family protein n=1 Tax=Nocardioides speluncae TaxID=2670337 RepID=UPI000D6859EF|nr:VOC family protein [Nocardioides speluncae]
MSTPSLTSIMLSSTDPERLHEWYRSAFPPQTDDVNEEYRVLGYGGVYLFIDTRDDVGPKTAEPGRVLLNFEVDDAHAAVERVERCGCEWLAPLEDRDGSLFATAIDPDGNYVQLIQLSEAHRVETATAAGQE